VAPPKAPGAAGQQKGSTVQTIVALAVLTLIAGGGGAFVGTMIGAPPPGAAPEAPAPVAPPAEKGRGDGGHGGGAGADNKHGDAAKAPPSAPVLKLKELAPIVTNLSNPDTSWIRLQASIIYDTAAVPHPDALAAEVMSDIVAFLRTVSLSSIEGADGLRRLHEDLTDRVVTRSDGHVREIIIQGVVVQ
jgi:flagellar protein FliL